MQSMGQMFMEYIFTYPLPEHLDRCTFQYCMNVIIRNIPCFGVERLKKLSYLCRTFCHICHLDYWLKLLIFKEFVTAKFIFCGQLWKFLPWMIRSRWSLDGGSLRNWIVREVLILMRLNQLWCLLLGLMNGKSNIWISLQSPSTQK